MTREFFVNICKRASIITICLLLSFQCSNINFKTKALTNSDNVEELQNSNVKGSVVYREYLNQYIDSAYPKTEIKISADEFIESSNDVKIMTDSIDGEDNSVFTSEESFVKWNIAIPETGLYNMAIRLYPYEGKGGDINRVLKIDGEVPFEEASYLTINRIWSEYYKSKKTDSSGNDIKPDETEVKRWSDWIVSDSTGYEDKPLYFYLTKGIHTVELSSQREPLVIGGIKFYQEKEIPSYSDIEKEYVKKDLKSAEGDNIYIQAEEMYEKSSRSIYRVNDRSSSATQPQDIFKIKLNSMGGSTWKSAGSWVSWKVKVNESGLYKIVPRYIQNFYSGSFVSRKLKIDGEVPFKEAESVQFNYSSDWDCKPLGDSENGDWKFWFEADREYVISMEVVLGNMGEVLNGIKGVVENLNLCYREILMITGATPDSNREYNFEEVIPDTLKKLKEQEKLLKVITEEMVKATGQRGERISTLEQLAFLLNNMTENPSEIGALFSQFKDNISSLGSWITQTAQQPLTLDYIALVPSDKEIPSANDNFFKRMFFGVKAFIASFVIDYSNIGAEDTDGDNLEVWLSTGRDQYTVIRQLIDSDFTPQYGITINLKLVGAGTLLPSVLTGKGPDVSLSNALDSTTSIENPIDFAVRHAVVDLTEFDDFDQVTKRFKSSALVPYKFNGGVYALPETQSFNMMFIRTDIFEEMGLSVPKTWDDMEIIIPELQKKNMSIGIPHDLNALLMFMYQRNTSLYLNDGAKSNLDATDAIQCFKKLTEYFTLYNLPTDYDFYNRFRSGEIPVAIQDYTAYNQLTLFAPEIRGNWIMTAIPGTLDDSGNINNTTTARGTAVMMLEGVKNKANAWEFMKWWTSAKTQSDFTVQMQAVLSTAMQATANVEALAMLPWTVDDYKNISAQWETVVGTPEVPGGYYTTRIVNFAFNEVYNTKKDPGDVLQGYIESLNSELSRKRKEFGLQ